jgi:hypothetical protein
MGSANPTQIADGGKTNQTKGSLVKVVVKANEGNWKQPTENEIFYIDEDANFPKINFELNWRRITSASGHGISDGPPRQVVYGNQRKEERQSSSGVKKASRYMAPTLGWPT